MGTSNLAVFIQTASRIHSDGLRSALWIALTQSSESEAGRLRMHSFTLP